MSSLEPKVIGGWPQRPWKVSTKFPLTSMTSLFLNQDVYQEGATTKLSGLKVVNSGLQIVNVEGIEVAAVITID